MEYWNDGILEYWELLNIKRPPLFHHSIFPTLPLFPRDVLQKFLRLLSDLWFHIGTAERFDHFSRCLGTCPHELYLRERKEIALDFGLELDRLLEVLFGGGEVFILNHLKEAEQMMSRTEVGHQSKGFLELGTNLDSRGAFQGRIPIRGMGG